MKIKIELDAGAHMPTKAHSTDAAFDLYANENAVVTAGAPLMISTGVHMAIPEGYVGLIFPRSSMILHGYPATPAVIDAGFTGEIKVGIVEQKTNSLYKDEFCNRMLLASRSDSILKGERIGQILILKLPDVELEEGDVKNLKTERGANGYGSSGR